MKESSAAAEYWEEAVLDPLQTKDMAVTGLATRKMMWTETALKCLNEAASGTIRDLS